MPLPSRTKQHLSTFFRFAFSGLLLWYLYTKMDIQKTLEIFRTAEVSLLGFAFLIFLLCNIIILLRWTIVVRALGLKAVPFKVIVRYFFIGLFGNLFLPSAIGGDVIKAIGLCRYSPERSKALASILLDRLLGFAGIVLLAALALIFSYRLINEPSIIGAVIAMASASVLIVLVLMVEKIYAFGCRLFSRFPKIKESLMALHYDAVLIKGRKDAVAQALGMSVLSQVILAVVFYVSARALGQEFAFIYFLLFIPLICVAASFPSIGGLGVREAGAAYLFTKVGMSVEVAVGISFLSYIFMVLVGLIGGVIYMLSDAPSPQAATNEELLLQQKNG